MELKAAAWLCVALLAGCAATPDWSLFRPPSERRPARPGAFDFAWRLSGDRQTAPLQVFDDGRATWLQFAPGQAVPAIFASASDGDVPLPYRREGPYIVLDGVWPALLLRGGSLQTRVERAAPRPAPVSAPAEPPLAVPVPQAPAAAAPRPAEPPGRPPASLFAAAVARAAGLPAASAPGEAEAAGVPTSGRRYSVGPQDGNLRLALARWASETGWTFQAEHWAVDVDIPIVGMAEFQGSFQQAVQQLVGSTELSERPLQPCFYANKVLRIVPYARSCDRSAPLGRT